MDYGCGDGGFIYNVISNGNFNSVDFYGIDFDKRAIEWASLFLGLANSKRPLPFSNYIFWIAALMLFAANFFFYGKALSEIKISHAYPALVGGTTLIIFLLDCFVFGNKLGAKGLFGATLLITGLVIMNQ
jgi:multidrug transporter EmrE-like cation transporter